MGHIILGNVDNEEMYNITILVRYSSLAKILKHTFNLHDEYSKFITETINSGIPVPYSPPKPLTPDYIPFIPIPNIGTSSNLSSNPNQYLNHNHIHNLNHSTRPNSIIDPIVSTNPIKSNQVFSQKNDSFEKTNWLNSTNICGCGGNFMNRNLERHRNTKKHILYIDNQKQKPLTTNPTQKHTLTLNTEEEENSTDDQGEEEDFGPSWKKARTGSIVVHSDDNEKEDEILDGDDFEEEVLFPGLYIPHNDNEEEDEVDNGVADEDKGKDDEMDDENDDLLFTNTNTNPSTVIDLSSDIFPNIIDLSGNDFNLNLNTNPIIVDLTQEEVLEGPLYFPSSEEEPDNPDEEET